MNVVHYYVMSSTPQELFVWARTKDETLTLLETTEHGLTSAAREARTLRYGPNQITTKKQPSVASRFIRQFRSPLIFILLFAGVLTTYLGKHVDAAVIFLALTVNAILGFYHEGKAEHTLEKLRSYIKERVRVFRDGSETEVDAESLVPGDVIHIGYGTRIPADARLIHVTDLAINEAILTGESIPRRKSLDPVAESALITERPNMVFGGTMAVEGYGTAVVAATGRNTEIGKLADLVTSTKRHATPLQRAVSRLAWAIAIAMLLIVSGIFALGLTRGIGIHDMLLVSAAIAVSAIPEALPIALTVILAVGAEHIARRGGIMRSLAAVETLGSTTVIITDKTGTLTQARMELVDVLPSAQAGEKRVAHNNPLVRLTAEQRHILSIGLLNTDVLVTNPDDPENEWEFAGHPLEVNIAKSSVKHGINPVEFIRATQPRILLPFNSTNKFSSVFTDKGNFHRESCISFLGAPDILLKRSALSKEDYLRLSAALDIYGADGKRVLGVATKRVAHVADAEKLDLRTVDELDFLGMIVFSDPIRPEVPTAIRKIERSGVTVVIATGDIKGTALAVARELGWKVDESSVITGDQLRQLTDEELLANMDHLKVYARMTPEDKYRIGMLYQKRGEIVGMTGDGVNDAPSLKVVDIGIAVGSGSDVAKDVADLVLLKDDFRTIVLAIEEGRRILQNIKKVFVYLMSNAMDAVFLIGGSLLLGFAMPLTALQIIWVNFFTGSLPALSFAFDDFLDKDHITARSARTIIDGEVKFLTLGIGLLTSSLLLVLYWFLITRSVPDEIARTFIFACHASYILFVSFSLRSLTRPLTSYNPFSNSFMNAFVFIGITLITLSVYTPPLQGIFSTTSLPSIWLWWVIVWIVFNVLLVEFAKWLYREWTETSY